MEEEEFDGFLILVRNQTWKPCWLSGISQHPALCRRDVLWSLAASAMSYFAARMARLWQEPRRSALFFDRPWRDDGCWFIHGVFFSPPSRQMSCSIFHEQAVFEIPPLNSADSCGSL